MAQYKRKNIQDNAIGSDKIALDNNKFLKADNFAKDGFVEILKVDENDEVVFPLLESEVAALEAADAALQSSIDDLESDVAALFPASVTVESAGFTASYNSVHVCTATLSVQLPEPVNKTKIVLKLLGEYVITLVQHNAENIDGQSSNYLLQSTNESVTLISNGTDWFII